jgi:hypothetical protein
MESKERYLPHAPRTFRELILADLLRAQRLILRIQDQIDPQFRIASPEGDWWIAMTLSSDIEERHEQMQMVSRFMRWKLAPAFTVASELQVPDAVYCFGATHREWHAVVARIVRDPIKFAAEEWLTREQVGDEYMRLLPKGSSTLDARELAELNEWFGPAGKFPAVKISDDRSGRHA